MRKTLPTTILVTIILAVALGGTQSQALAQTPFAPAGVGTETDVVSNVELVPSAHAFDVSDNLLSNVDALNSAESYNQQFCDNDCRQPFESDHEFDGFIEPVTNFVFFEDPRSRTRLRFIFANQMIPEDSILAGGDLQLFATQLSVAVNDRFSIIAQKDGYITLQSDALPNDEGFADLMAGLKYVLVRDPYNQFLLSGGFLYEGSNGSSGVFQGDGNGMFHFFLSTGKEFGRCDDWHFVGTAGWHLPVDGGNDTESLYYSLHLDRRLSEKFYVLWELTGIEYVDSGRRLLGVNVEGGDLINLGAADVDGNHFASTAFGITCKLNSYVQASAAYEFPITSREDLMDNRTTITLSLIY